MKKVEPKPPPPKPTPNVRHPKAPAGWACHVCGLVDIELERCPIDGSEAP